MEWRDVPVVWGLGARRWPLGCLPLLCLVPGPAGSCGRGLLGRVLGSCNSPGSFGPLGLQFWIGLRESGLMGTARWALQGTCQWALSKEMHSCLHVRISLRLPACSQARVVFTRANYHVAVQAPWPGQEVACMRPHTWVGSQGGGPPLGKGARPAGGGPPLLRPPSGPHLAAAVCVVALVAS